MRRSRLLLISLAFVAFISLGLPDGLLGVAWPSIRETFGLSLDALGPLLVMFTIGYLVSSFSSGEILHRMGVGTLLAASGFATAISLLGYGLAPTWIFMVMLGVLAGLGAGAIDAGLNTYVATNFSTRTLNWLHAFFGFGAALGPLIMTVVLNADLPWRRGYLIVGAAQVLLALCFLVTRRRWQVSEAQQEATPQPSNGASMLSTLRLPATWLGIAIFLLYTGLEIATGQWTYSLFTLSRGVAPTTAGFWISVYWGSLTVGRILFGIIVTSAPVERLLAGCMVVIAVGAGLLALNLSDLLSFFGLALMGFAFAPIFPSLISTTPARIGPAHTANAVGFQVAAASLGGALLPWTVGILASWIGLEVLGPFLLGGALALLGLYALLTVNSRSSHPRPASEAVAD
jgi:fucose permease